MSAVAKSKFHAPSAGAKSVACSPSSRSRVADGDKVEGKASRPKGMKGSGYDGCGACRGLSGIKLFRVPTAGLNLCASLGVARKSGYTDRTMHSRFSARPSVWMLWNELLSDLGRIIRRVRIADWIHGKFARPAVLSCNKSNIKTCDAPSIKNP